MTREQFDEWCRQLSRCRGAISKRSGRPKVIWPTRALAERAADLMRVEDGHAESLAYRCPAQYGCHLWHVTTEPSDYPSRKARQRRNQPDTYREKCRRQRQARRARDRNRGA